MATKAKPKSRVSSSSRLTQFKFQWWIALILVGIVAVIGIVILRFSNAGVIKEIGMAESDVKTTVHASRDGYATIGNQTDSSLPGSGVQQTIRAANSNSLPTSSSSYMVMTMSYADKLTYTTTNATVSYCIYVKNTGVYTTNGVTLATYGSSQTFTNGTGGYPTNNGYVIYCRNVKASTLGDKDAVINSTFQAFIETKVSSPNTKILLWRITREVFESAK